MKPRTTFILGGLAVMGTAGYLMASSIKSTTYGVSYRGIAPDTFTEKYRDTPGYRSAAQAKT